MDIKASAVLRLVSDGVDGVEACRVVGYPDPVAAWEELVGREEFLDALETRVLPSVERLVRSKEARARLFAHIARDEGMKASDRVNALAQVCRIMGDFKDSLEVKFSPGKLLEAIESSAASAEQ